ncbi:calpain family cysteine protease containing protein [Stylonychia lemnae]|uniref:Calpain family cysteine protease containing protein n=1 Tax=Stylonychia lemnae TaxID=5949 RepID=A0A078AGW7_STYLE|nr:calpain family cysteine protease containing protein [Stylonychia lemnae]|eukprot:CDW81091.1 calpain family cysteine protease containing protein [Stylonychia lemnae]
MSFSPSDVFQGEIKNNLFIALIGSLAQQNKLNDIIATNQLNPERYFGVYFYVQGQRKMIIVDDYLPTLNDQMIYAKQGKNQQIWVPLLEKAWAKFNGNYEFMEQADNNINQLFQSILNNNATIFRKTDPNSINSDVVKLRIMLQNYLDNQIPFIIKTAQNTNNDGLIINQYGIPYDSYNNVISIHQILDVDGNIQSNILRLRDTCGDDSLNSGPFHDNDLNNWTPEIQVQVPYVNDLTDGYFFILDTLLLEILDSVIAPTTIHQNFRQSRLDILNDDSTYKTINIEIPQSNLEISIGTLKYAKYLYPPSDQCRNTSQRETGIMKLFKGDTLIDWKKTSSLNEYDYMYFNKVLAQGSYQLWVKMKWFDTEVKDYTIYINTTTDVLIAQVAYSNVTKQREDLMNKQFKALENLNFQTPNKLSYKRTLFQFNQTSFLDDGFYYHLFDNILKFRADYNFTFQASGLLMLSQIPDQCQIQNAYSETGQNTYLCQCKIRPKLNLSSCLYFFSMRENEISSFKPTFLYKYKPN